MMKVAIDCNIFVSCLSSRSRYHHIYTALITGKFQLVISQEILLEYEEIIQIKYGTTTSTAFINLLALLSNVQFVHPFYRWNLIYIDPDDNKYCDCAVSGNADFIVTEDGHFDVLKHVNYPRIKVLSMIAFSDMLIKRNG